MKISLQSEKTLTLDRLCNCCIADRETKWNFAMKKVAADKVRILAFGHCDSKAMVLLGINDS